MPIPKPNQNESRDDFVSRCMEAIGDEYDDNDQAVAVCMSAWRDSQEDKEPNDRLLAAVRRRQQKRSEFEYGILTADRWVANVRDRIGIDACYKLIGGRHNSFDDVMRKAACRLTYSSPDAAVKEVEYERPVNTTSLKELDGIELPKNTLMVFRHVLTTPRKDRDGDILRTQGAVVDPKMLLLWQHLHDHPIGKMLVVSEQNSKRLELISCIVDMNPLCHDAAVMVDSGMGRFSHGFRALNFAKLKAEEHEEPGFDVKDYEVMEESLVSVPSNVDAETEEVLLSLVEGGKLTSPLMKQYGLGIRETRSSRISVPVDLKLTVNGKEIDNADVGGNRTGTGEGQKQEAGTSKEADGEGRREESGQGKTENKEVNTFHQEAKARVSKKLLTAIKESYEDVKDLRDSDYIEKRGGIALCERVMNRLKRAIDEYGDDEDEMGGEKPKSVTVEDAVSVVLACSTPAQRKRLADALRTMDEVDSRDELTKQYHALKRAKN